LVLFITPPFCWFALTHFCNTETRFFLDVMKHKKDFEAVIKFVDTHADSFMHVQESKVEKAEACIHLHKWTEAREVLEDLIQTHGLVEQCPQFIFYFLFFFV
jgi:hypothetical protein